MATFTLGLVLLVNLSLAYWSHAKHPYPIPYWFVNKYPGLAQGLEMPCC
jgi:hypothetical protein